MCPGSLGLGVGPVQLVASEEKNTVLFQVKGRSQALPLGGWDWGAGPGK